ncbi:endonuclease domain-containing protein [Streptomyces sp. NPDC001530]|uniref:endonuclease domain-containing protein n=1 Tax=Streptomyces sp. NPDC001530 TaxID=3364582 RepID=UPI0036997299
MSTRAAEAAFRRAQNRHSKSGNPCHHFTYHRLTCDEYDGLQTRAGGCCEICRTPALATGGRRLVVDHFESTHPYLRIIRGMLCDACNSAMSCLDGTKRWGSNRSELEPRAREYQARVLRDLPLAQLALIERVQERRGQLVAAPRP